MHRFMKLGPGIFWVWIAILSEGLGGVLVALGLFGPFPAATLAADLTVVTILAHVPKGFWVGNGGWEFPVPLAAGALAIGLIGNGRYSLD